MLSGNGCFVPLGPPPGEEGGGAAEKRALGTTPVGTPATRALAWKAVNAAPRQGVAPAASVFPAASVLIMVTDLG